MKIYVAELHVHTVLSPCADVEMIPPLIVRAALDKGLDLIAITDHNASANVAAVQQAAQGTGLTVLPGMEVQTREEVHVLCVFDTPAQIEAWQQIVDAQLPALDNDIEHFGEQFVVDAEGDFIRRETRLLIVSTSLSLEETVGRVNSIGGLAIPAHVDRKAFGLIEHLGFVPPDLPIAAIEVSRHLSPLDAVKKFPQLRGYPLVQGGDAHRLDELLGANVFELVAPTVDELRLALAGREGRRLTQRVDKPRVYP